VNIARLRAPIDSPLITEFAAALEPINALAEKSPGFVWRYDESGDGHVTPVDPNDDLVIVNLSVWESYADLHAFAFRSEHGQFLRRRTKWFERMDGPTAALWWVRAGHTPTVPEAIERLNQLRDHGPTPQAFSMRHRYDAVGRPDS
jgi:hypothetical protein